jgi:hypothetical protein
MIVGCMQHGALHRWTCLARTPEKRALVHGSRRQRAWHQTWICRTTPWVSFFRFYLESLYVWFRTVRSHYCPRVRIMFAPSYPLYVVCFAPAKGMWSPDSGWSLPVSSRFISMDPSGFAEFHGLRSFYRPLAVYSPGRQFPSHIAITDVSRSTSINSRPLLLQASGYQKSCYLKAEAQRWHCAMLTMHHRWMHEEGNFGAPIFEM